ncbi:MAG: sugar phosphate isomerase/epimerase [Bacteroidales bacterium]|nr:sugar phosphate isomerase/epimerase [Bacteroidales bacterium]
MRTSLRFLLILLLLVGCKAKGQEPFDWDEYYRTHPYELKPIDIAPTTALGKEGEDTKGFRYAIGYSVNILDDTIEQELQALQKAGIRYIELKFKYSGGYNFQSRTDEDILSHFDTISHLLEKYEITPWSIHLPYDNASWTNPGAVDEKIRKQSEDYLLRVIRLTAIFKVKCYVLHAGKGTIGNMSTAISQAKKTITVLKEAAKANGGRICVENLIGSLAYNWEDLQAIVSDFDDVYTTLDVGHANINMGHPSEYAKQMGTKLGTVHIDDNLGSTDNHLLPGNGNIPDWKEIYETFLNVNRYRGVFIFEPSGTSYSAQEAADAYKNFIWPKLKPQKEE